MGQPSTRVVMTGCSEANYGCWCSRIQSIFGGLWLRVCAEPTWVALSGAAQYIGHLNAIIFCAGHSRDQVAAAFQRSGI